MSTPAEEFYSEERWQNWLDRLRESDLDPEEEESARLLLNLQDDVAIAIAKIIRAYEEEIDEEEAIPELDAEGAIEELADLRSVVLAEPEIEDEEAALLLERVQDSLVSAIYAADQYIAEGVAADASVAEYLRAAADAENEEEFDRALGLVAAAGTRVIDGEELDVSIAEDLEYGLVTEWINGLDSLQSAVSDPVVIEEDTDR
ncbi:MAG: DUF2150 family protein [Halobacteriales archaeon]